MESEKQIPPLRGFAASVGMTSSPVSGEMMITDAL
jgi:hypothetical protein